MIFKPINDTGGILMKVKLICHHEAGYSLGYAYYLSFIYSSQQTIIRMLDYAAKSYQGVLQAMEIRVYKGNSCYSK